MTNITEDETNFQREMDIIDIDHLGIVAGIIDEIDIVSIVDKVIPIDKREKISAGNVVKAIILNNLGFVSKPLYLFCKFFEDIAVEHLLGTGIKSTDLNDDKIGRVMDDLYKYGLSDIFYLISMVVVKKYQIATNYSHLDSTSFHLHGKYNQDKKEEIDNVQTENPIIITKGYSRDHRPDLNQCILNLITTNDGDIPVYIKTGSGNDSDKTEFGKIIKEYSSRIEFSSVMVADSALYTANNLKIMSSLKWITRVPLSIKRAKELIKSKQANELKELEQKWSDTNK